MCSILSRTGTLVNMLRTSNDMSIAVEGNVFMFYPVGLIDETRDGLTA